MTLRERILAVLHGLLIDCVPCCPDISTIVPCRLTGKPFWDIYLLSLTVESPPDPENAIIAGNDCLKIVDTWKWSRYAG